MRPSTPLALLSFWGDASDAMKDAVRDRSPRPHVELLDEIYSAEPTQLLKIIRKAEDTDPERLMLIGHNPGMHALTVGLLREGGAGSALIADPKASVSLSAVDVTDEACADDTRLAGFVLGTNDLSKEMRASLTPARTPFLPILTQTVCAARAHAGQTGAWRSPVLRRPCQRPEIQTQFLPPTSR